MLGCAEPHLKVQSMHYVQEIAAIRACCDNDKTFRILMENYDDNECFSMDTEVLEEDEAELMFGELPRKLTPAEEVEYQRYQAEWDRQDRAEHQQQEKITHANEEYNAQLQAQEEADKKDRRVQRDLLLVQ